MDRLATRLVKLSGLPLAMILLVLGDLLAIAGALCVSLSLESSSLSLFQLYRVFVVSRSASLILTILAYVSFLAIFRLYRCAWRFAGLETARGVAYAGTLGTVASVALQWAIHRSVLPARVMVDFWLMSMLLIGGVRVILRAISLGRRYGSRAVNVLRKDLRPRRVVILGAGTRGVHVLDYLRSGPSGPYDIVGFLDDDPNKRGIYIRDVKVLGPISELRRLLSGRLVDQVLVALPDACGEEIREYFTACRAHGVQVKIIPGIREAISGRTAIRIEDISVEDLLRRPPVKIDLVEIGEFIATKRVLVTGAGGSIGSELCRQIIALNPSVLVLLGHGENSIHRIYHELRRTHPQHSNRLRQVIASVSDETRINQVFAQFRPQVVFHAAAHKHVPIMEMNVLEAINNNVLGTFCVADACGRSGTKCMVLISSDKAVCPSSVMGATKWICEKLVLGMASMYRDTNYVAVRFGNVLGSRGSVLPIFHEQIMRGGPVTVTHPEMTRYFMSIPEAVQLVLQAAAVGRSEELYVLDMGKPVRILDLAHDMIRLCGYEPGVDIPVVISGPRPGEKLHERLIAEDEVLEPAYGEGMSVIRCSHGVSAAEVADLIRQCRLLVSRGDSTEAYDFLVRTVPEMAENTLVGRES